MTKTIRWQLPKRKQKFTFEVEGDGPRVLSLTYSGFVPVSATLTVMSTPSSPARTYALVLAGGSGQRFWPVSRDRLPKQLLRLFDEKTLLEHTINRLAGVVPRENILILTNCQQVEGVREALPDFPAENIIAEPEKRDTAPAIALAIAWSPRGTRRPR